MKRPNGYRAIIPLAVATSFGAPAADAQQVLEIDYATGRTIIDDQWRSMRASDLAVDRGRGILYVIDAEEPEGVMAFSLETGEWIRTIQTPEGDGPREFPAGRRGIAAARDGALYAAGPKRVIEYDSAGAFVSSWIPDWATSFHVCDFGGEPAIPIPEGVIRRGPEGREDVLPSPDAEQSRFVVLSEVQGRTAMTAHVDFRIACGETSAFVVRSYDHGPDSVFVYHRGGEVGRVAVPTDFADWAEDCGEEVTTPSGHLWRIPCPIWNRGLYPSFDGRGNLVLFSEVDFETAGTIIDPETGCYAIVRKDPSTGKARVPVRILGDSVLVFRNHSEPNENGGTTYYADSANRASLHPLRRVSGEPCPGILPTVKGVG
ncbi:MAG: hypothetical protein OXG58_09050 [Gemmatimonadetes bacterium]|nr:hypothetical protein [Gemmatimonadota bacterium]MCY3943999.1 hypothetical protein [Gemmatimonadota bacterium]